MWIYCSSNQLLPLSCICHDILLTTVISTQQDIGVTHGTAMCQQGSLSKCLWKYFILHGGTNKRRVQNKLIYVRIDCFQILSFIWVDEFSSGEYLCLWGKKQAAALGYRPIWIGTQGMSQAWLLCVPLLGHWLLLPHHWHSIKTLMTGLQLVLGWGKPEPFWLM